MSHRKVGLTSPPWAFPIGRLPGTFSSTPAPADIQKPDM